MEIYQQTSDSNLSGSSLTPRTFGQSFPTIQEHEGSKNLADALHYSQLVWKLNPTDPVHNKMVREDFYFEQVRWQLIYLLKQSEKIINH